MPQQKTISHQQIREQQKRWNERAGVWDSDIQQQSHYVNFESGYHEFLRLEEEILEKKQKIETGLDIGCGTGVTSELLSRHVSKIYVLDIAKKMLEEAKKKVPAAITICASATQIPLDDASIDIAVSRGVVVSHLPRDIYLNFFREIERIVKIGGIVLFDYLSNLESVHFSIQSSKILFSKEEIEIILLGHGFEKIKFYGSQENRVVRVSAVRTK